MRSKLFLIAAIIAFVLLLLPEPTLLAQCPMCKSAAESNLKEGGTHGLGLNAGILYLLAAPYLIVAFLGYRWWRNQKQTEVAE